MRWYIPYLALDRDGWRARKRHYTRAMLERPTDQKGYEHDRRMRHRHRRRAFRQRIRLSIRRAA